MSETPKHRTVEDLHELFKRSREGQNENPEGSEEAAEPAEILEAEDDKSEAKESRFTPQSTSLGSNEKGIKKAMLEAATRKVNKVVEAEEEGIEGDDK